MTDQEIRQYQQDLVEGLKKDGNLTLPQVERAFLAVPRHLFLPGEPLAKVYSDTAIAVRRGVEGQWTSSSSQPAIMAIMLEQLDLQPGQRVLEIGTGSGFNAALIAEMVGQQGKVVTMDIQTDLIEEARQHLQDAGYPWVQAVAGDGGYGYPPEAPFDRIILTAGSTVVPPAWREQLTDGGRLVLPLGAGSQISVAFERRREELVSVSVVSCGFMMLQGAFAAPPPFQTQIGPDLRLSIHSPQELPVDGDQISAWLNVSGKDWPTGVSAALLDFMTGLVTWLGIHLPNSAMLVVSGNLANDPSLPHLVDFGGEWKSTHTMILVEQDGLAALTRPPGQAAPLEDMNRLGQDPAPLELYVRQFGPGEHPVQQFLQSIQAWDQAGRPQPSRLKLRALPAEKEIQLAKDEFLLDRPYTQFVVSYLPG